MSKLALTALLAILVGIWIGHTMIALGIAGALALVSLSKSSRSKEKAKEPEPQEEEETILHPVVYEDAGEPPNLYPEGLWKINVYPKGKWDKRSAIGIPKGAANLVKGTVKGVKKLLK